MASPAYFGKLVCFTSSLRKPALIPFGLFSPQDNLSFIADMPGNTTTFQNTLTPPDGIRNTFLFSELPIYIIWNGLQQREGVGFTLTGPVAGIYAVQFTDFAGNILTPGATDDIYAETTILNIPSQPGTLPTKVAVPWASNLIIDTSLAQIITVLLTDNVVSTTLIYGPSAIPNNVDVMLRFTQDSVGAHTVALPSNLAFDTGFAIDQGANRTTVMQLLYNSNTGSWIFAATPFSVQGT